MSVPPGGTMGLFNISFDAGRSLRLARRPRLELIATKLLTISAGQ